MWSVLLAFVNYFSVFINCQPLPDCHDDPAFVPIEGPLDSPQFTWLGVLQYIHVKRGNPHYFRAPRVVLVSRQFVLSTAFDAAQVPEGYALGNIVFGEYERDEVECGVTTRDLADGVLCEPSILIMPILDVLLHPEYKHFNVKNSVALLKLISPIKSSYMLPACLPFKNYLVDKNEEQIAETIIHIDFIADVPRDFAEEDKEINVIGIIPENYCYIYDTELPQNSSKIAWTRVLCTTGCGFHSGAPAVVHEHTGHVSLVALTIGSHQCPDPLRYGRYNHPPLHLTVHPYVSWITAAITGRSVGIVAKDDPFGFPVPRAREYGQQKQGWVGRWWMGGIRCYDRGEAASDLFKFYHEVFQLTPTSETFLTYNLEINAPPKTRIVCVKVGMPFAYGEPRVWEMDTPIVKLRIPLLRFKYKYKFYVEGWGQNLTDPVSLEDYMD